MDRQTDKTCIAAYDCVNLMSFIYYSSMCVQISCVS